MKKKITLLDAEGIPIEVVYDIFTNQELKQTINRMVNGALLIGQEVFTLNVELDTE